MDQSQLQFGDSSIEVHHQGAHLSSWVYQGKEQLFLSRQALFEPAKAIRGGVPICFPQFAAFGPGRYHGFARNMLWQPCETSQPNLVRFELVHNKDTLELWPHEFKAQFDIELMNNILNMCLRVENVGSDAMEFTAALHSYFSVDAIQNAFVAGLQACQFWEKGSAFTQRQHQQPSELRVDQVIDRVYFNSPNALRLVGLESTRLIEAQGFADTVIWNPWREGASALVDMADHEYQQMLCIESANVQTPVHLDPGAVWQGVQKITVE